MEFLQILILAIVQGLTEFLPISSSAHLILLPQFMQWDDQGLAIDIAVHIGTLLAVVLYFKRDSLSLAGGALDVLAGRTGWRRRLFLNIVLATIPVILAGFMLFDMAETAFRNMALIGTTSILFGLMLWGADRKAAAMAEGRAIENMPVTHALLIGLAQALALLPGVSRSGVTMTAALFLGYGRLESARFSLLLSMPTILAAGTLIAIELITRGNGAALPEMLLAGGLSFVCGFAAIWAMMHWLRRFSFTPFVIYRLALGAVLLSLLF